MAKFPLPPSDYNQFIGGGDFEKIGLEFLDLFKTLAGLTPDAKVLDIGCGCGRIAYPLAEFLNSKGSYEGFDTNPVMIDWCLKVIQPKQPNFHFQFVDVYNLLYNPASELKSYDSMFLYPSNTFDFACAISVFTHMYEDDIIQYLNETKRVLKRGGKLFATFFIGDEILGNEYKRIYTEKVVRDFFDKSGLKIEDLKYGNWCPRSVPTLGFQDILIAKK